MGCSSTDILPFLDHLAHQFGSSDRSEHMLMYYFPQWQVTNHRVENTPHAIEDVMECESLDVFIHALLLQHEMGIDIIDIDINEKKLTVVGTINPVEEPKK
ncbi:hypothetical protein KSP39_PZI001885 [Platanthera zijinensis]|uniref:Uncharacterized protein n=1 Tax=Platanthera zijinensis TaxID=2320716 RepID=A0AAP0C161_9ASPA